MKKLPFFGVMAGALLAIASTAQAHMNVDIGIGVPGVVYADPAPIYVYASVSL